MKIAVAAMGKNVAGHFGHCENFIFFDTADGGITAPSRLPAQFPGGQRRWGGHCRQRGRRRGGHLWEAGCKGDPGSPGRRSGGGGGLPPGRAGLQRLCLPQARARRRVRRASVIKQAPRDDRRAAGDRGAPSAFSGPSEFPSGKNTQGWLEIVREAGIFLLLFRIDL